MSTAVKKAEGSENLGPRNFREFARRTIQSYSDKGMVIDALLWGRIIAHYEAKITRLKKKVEELEDR